MLLLQQARNPYCQSKSDNGITYLFLNLEVLLKRTPRKSIGIFISVSTYINIHIHMQVCMDFSALLGLHQIFLPMSSLLAN